MMGRPGAPATKRNNAPNKKMAGFPFGCLVLEVGHMTVVEQGGRALGIQGWGGPIEGVGAPRCSLHHHLQDAAARFPLHAGAIAGDKKGHSLQEREGRADRTDNGSPSISCLASKPSLPGTPSTALPRHNMSERFWIVMQHQASSQMQSRGRRQGPLSIYQTLRLPSITALFALPSLFVFAFGVQTTLDPLLQPD
jgi:hypothetical protein